MLPASFTELTRRIWLPQLSEYGISLLVFVVTMDCCDPGILNYSYFGAPATVPVHVIWKFRVPLFNKLGKPVE